mmetsp:Transcript_127096/g.220262  ORF Transcript_127096/g.220262 Transcript_127096/m.220262 type:complete len:525 (+) Transcript_127096:84-1658(+)
MAPTTINPATPVIYLHPKLKLVEFPKKGYGYMATATIKRGELLLEEKPFVWDLGKDPNNLDMGPGADWLLQSGAINDLPHPVTQDLTEHEHAEAVARSCAFRVQAPCADGHYPGFLFRASSRFNHSCYPGAGGYMPGGLSVPSVDACGDLTMRTFAVEELRKSQEICICYLSDADQLSPTESRQSALQSWGFTCDCMRCLGGRPLDSRLKGAKMDDFADEVESRRAVHASNREFRALFDPTADEYNPPPSNDFEAILKRLTDFKQQHKFLDPANMVMQRIRREILGLLLIKGEDSEIAKKFSGMIVENLLEDLRVKTAMLPALSPTKVGQYAQFHRMLQVLPPSEADWFLRAAKVDGCDVQARAALYLHDPAEFKRLGLDAARNIPDLPKPGPPPRQGPEPTLGACCLPALGQATALRPQVSLSCTTRPRWRNGGRKGRAVEAEVTAEDMPMLLGQTDGVGAEIRPEEKVELHIEEPKLANLWEAYAEYGSPTTQAKKLRGQGGGILGKEKVVKKNASWFKFRK